MKRWRRPLILIALLLLAGAVVNAAVALWIAERTNSTRWRDETPNVLRSIPVPDDWPAWCHRGTGTRFGALAVSEWTLCESDPARVAWATWESWEARQFRAGWPAHALVRETLLYTEASPTKLAKTTFLPLSPWRSGIKTRTAHRVPIRPIPTGFAINTLFYAVVVGAILAPPLSASPIRRRLRARRGRCPKCGYDLAGLVGAGAEGGAPCPECGATALRARAPASNPRSAEGRSEGSTR